jgi:hypothetical protein
MGVVLVCTGEKREEMIDKCGYVVIIQAFGFLMVAVLFVYLLMVQNIYLLGKSVCVCAIMCN